MRDSIKLGIAIVATAVLTHAFSGATAPSHGPVLYTDMVEIRCSGAQITNALATNGANGSIDLLVRTIAGAPSSYNGFVTLDACVFDPIVVPTP